MLPKKFVHLKDIDASIMQDIKYFTKDNFVGRPIDGYEVDSCVLTDAAAHALMTLQLKLIPQSLSLKVFDGYRPQRAVDHFIKWSKDPADQLMKSEYYPRVNKADLFKLDYLAEKSSHSSGSTVDLTLVQLFDDRPPCELDMGTQFDFLDELSHPFSDDVTPEVKQNRLMLRQLMEEAGFIGIRTEWWHFTLKDEPFPDTYFDFVV